MATTKEQITTVVEVTVKRGSATVAARGMATDKGSKGRCDNGSRSSR